MDPALPANALGYELNRRYSGVGKSPHGARLLIPSFLVFTPVSLIMLRQSIESFSAFVNTHPGFMIAGIASLIGYLPFSIATIRTRFYPRWLGYALILFTILGVLQVSAQWPDWVQHLAFIGTSLVVIAMGVWALRHEA